jgi:hypothetical protein
MAEDIPEPIKVPCVAFEIPVEKKVSTSTPLDIAALKAPNQASPIDSTFFCRPHRYHPGNQLFSLNDSTKARATA